MEANTYIYDNLPQIIENNENLYYDSQFSFKKMNYQKALFRMQSPEPSILDECMENENEKSFDIDFCQNQYTDMEHQEEYSQNYKNSIQKKIVKSKKLKKKTTRDEEGPLSEKEFIDIVKKLEQCQQVMQMLDNMSLILNRFKTQLIRDKSQSFKRTK